MVVEAETQAGGRVRRAAAPMRATARSASRRTSAAGSRHEPVASEHAELRGQLVDAVLDRLEPRVPAAHLEADLVEQPAELAGIEPEEVVELDALVSHLGDRAERSLGVARALVAQGVQRQPETGLIP